MNQNSNYSDRMTILYPVNIRFPMERANSIQIVNTCRALAENGVMVYLLVRRMSNRKTDEMLKFYGLTPHKNLKIIKVPVINYDNHEFIWNKSFYVSVVLYIFYFLLFKKIDVFFLRDLGLAKLFIKLKKIFGYKIVYETHIISYIVSENQHLLFPMANPVGESKIAQIKAKESFVYKNSDAMFVLTNLLKHRIIDEFSVDGDKINILPDGVNMELFDSSDSDKRDGLVYIGQLYPWKGVDTLIEAMQFIDSKLTVIGGVPFEDDLIRLRKKSEDLNLDNKITFTGFMKPEKISQYLKKAKISVIPLPDNVIARDFTSPLKLFESMAAKTAVVASDLPSIREVIRDGENGLLFEPGNPKSLADKIKLILKDEELYKCISEKSYSESQKYCWNARAKSIIFVLRKLKIC